jgi:hypothetical protein
MRNNFMVQKVMILESAVRIVASFHERGCERPESSLRTRRSCTTARRSPDPARITRVKGIRRAGDRRSDSPAMTLNISFGIAVLITVPRAPSE